MELCLSGLDESNRIYLKRFCTTIGLGIGVGLRKKTTAHLIGQDQTSKKFKMALACGVKIADEAWIYSLATLKESTVPHITDVTNGMWRFTFRLKKSLEADSP